MVLINGLFVFLLVPPLFLPNTLFGNILIIQYKFSCMLRIVFLLAKCTDSSHDEWHQLISALV